MIGPGRFGDNEYPFHTALTSYFKKRLDYDRLEILRIHTRTRRWGVL